MAETNLWPEVLSRLKEQMSRATFDAWLSQTTAVRRNGSLIVFTHSAYAQDWLKNRLRSTIQRVVNDVAGGEVPIEFEVDGGDDAYQPDLFFQGSYRDAYNEIVQPDDLLCTTRYYHDKWRPLLGNDLWLLIWEMRRRCFWNKANPDKSRDTIHVTFDELAAAVGVSRPTVRRLLSPKDGDRRALLARFVTRIGVRRSYSKKIGRTVNEKTTWRIRLDDPLTPDDEKRLDQTLSSKCQIDT